MRHRKGAEPTAAGEQLYPVARRLVTEVRELSSLFKPVDARRKLTLGLMRSLDVARTRTLLATITKMPMVDLVLVNEEDECDLRIVSRSMRKEGEIFVPSGKSVTSSPCRAVIRSRRRRRCVGRTRRERLIARCHCENTARVRLDGRQIDIVAVAPTEEWAIALVSAGVGIALVPEGSVASKSEVIVRPLQDVHAKREVGVAYGAKAPPAEVQKLVDGFTSRPPRAPERGVRRRSQRWPVQVGAWEMGATCGTNDGANAAPRGPWSEPFGRSV